VGLAGFVGIAIFMAGPFQVNWLMVSPSAAGRSGAADTGSLLQKIRKNAAIEAGIHRT
jgi:hypothetical protein